ncbi:hypothetical protein V8C86DRAFT_3107144 [Haematococcus lacustris]
MLRLQAHVAALAHLKLFRTVPPAGQSFFLVLAEPLWYTAQVRLNPEARDAAAEQDPTGQQPLGAFRVEEGAAWEPAAVARLNKPSYRLTLEEQATHLHPLPAQPHEAQEQAQGCRPPLPTQWGPVACAEGRAPPRGSGRPGGGRPGAAGEREQQGREEEGWLPEEVQGSQPPRWLDTPVRACPRLSREERFKGKDPELDAAHFDQLWPKRHPTGQQPLGAFRVEEGAAWEPAAVARLNKPSYRLTLEEQATHLHPLPAQPHEAQEQAQGCRPPLPTQWGPVACAEGRAPPRGSGRPGGGRPGAAGEREQQGREEEGWLPEEVQGSQPPRWLDTPVRACPRPSREERFKGKDPELDAAHFDQLQRLQAHVAALAHLKLFRTVPPAGQSFFSVLAEPLWYTAQVRLNPAARDAAAEQGQQPLGAFRVKEGAAWEPAAVARLNKPSYRLTLEEQATHLHPLPAQPHEAQEQAQGCRPPLPTQWGPVACAEGRAPPRGSGRPGGGRPGAAGEREQQGREEEGWLPEEVQGSQPPRWLDTPVRACPRLSREERFKGKDPELDAAHFDQLQRLQAHVAALAHLKLFRTVPPAGQSFFSVLAEPLWYTAQVRLNPEARDAAAEQDPTGQQPLGAFRVKEGAAWEPAAVARLNKPSYRLTLEEQATHLHPLPAQPHEAQEQAQGCRPPLPTQYGPVACAEGRAPPRGSGRPGGGRPGAAGEREQQGREEEGWLPEEVQGSQPPRWLDTPVRACPRPSREERFKGKDPELDAAHFDQLQRLQAHVAALAHLKLFRTVPPAGQSFFSVLAEPLWYTAQVRLNPEARDAAAEQDPTGQQPLGAFRVKEGAAWEPAAVARLNKPSYRLTLEEQATHLHPLPAQPHEAQEQAQGCRPPLPTQYGPVACAEGRAPPRGSGRPGGDSGG